MKQDVMVNALISEARAIRMRVATFIGMLEALQDSLRDEQLPEPTAPNYPHTITPQMQDVLTHLRTKGSITSLEALGVYNIYRLAARIKELRNLGFDINTERKHDHNGKQYARYSLA